MKFHRNFKMHDYLTSFHVLIIGIIVSFTCLLGFVSADDSTKTGVPGESVAPSLEPTAKHFECDISGAKGLCVEVAGEGQDQCDPNNKFDAFRACNRNECNGYLCQTVPGMGADECQVDRHCKHKKCSDGKCIEVPGAGKDECFSEYNCSYSTCQMVDDEAACNKIIGVRPEGHIDCNTSDDCYRSICENGACTYKLGTTVLPGETSCMFSQQCYHYELIPSEDKCKYIPTPGENSCDPGLAHPNSHLTCDANTGSCKRVVGKGENDCSAEGDFASCSHLECRGMSCAQVPGKSLPPGAKTCSDSKDCSRLVCENGFCARKEGKEYKKGEIACSNEGQRDACSRMVCEGMSCKAKSGPKIKGERPCSSNNNCIDSRCEEGFCKKSAGTGNSECSDYKNCRHGICNAEYGTCDTKYSIGESECTYSEDCPQPSTHSDCEGTACHTVSGFWPWNRCSENDDCYYTRCSGKQCQKKSGRYVVSSCLLSNNWPCRGYLNPGVSLEDLVTRSLSSKKTKNSSNKEDQLEAEKLKLVEQLVATEDAKKAKLNYIGVPGAPIKIEYFNDITCGMCKVAFRNILPRLVEDYVNTKKAWLVFREFPLLPTRRAISFSEAALCAKSQGMYEFYVPYLQSLGKEALIKRLSKYAQTIGMNYKKFRKCRKDNKKLKLIERDVEHGNSLKIDSTPTFIINGEKIVGVKDYKVFKKKIDALLSSLEN